MNAAVLHGAPGRHQRLGRDLTAKSPLSFLVGVATAEDVDLNRFEIKQFQKKIEGGGHVSILAGAREGPFAQG